MSGRFKRTPGYFEHRCDNYKKQVSVPVQTFFIQEVYLKLPEMKKGKNLPWRIPHLGNLAFPNNTYE